MKFRLYGLCLLIILIFAACQQNEKEESAPNRQNEDQFMQIENSQPNQNPPIENDQISNHLADVANNVPNVNNATAIVAGPYAVVAIDVDKELDRSRVGTIKYSVSEALQHDPYGKTAVVVADADATERIRSMTRKMQDGYPVQGIIDELSAIVGRYMPDFPINENKPEESDQNKEIIPEKDKDRLDDIEKEQSEEENPQ
ncbi:MAG TPA: YhcN/YlaJ family sporulation lipoprotein [Virgibacillus sp.]|nr:YhcN/YlaJ family sporulation lipoprotein [Virgibacillus sp.]